jgi:uncharacterized glyoxalase superfamily protein PhnB
MAETRLLAAVPQFLVANVVEAAQFYHDRLGFEIGPYGEPPLFVIVSRDRVQIMLNYSEEGAGSSNRVHKKESDDAYIWLSDLDAFWDEVKDNALNVTRGPAVAPYGVKEFTVEDNSGYSITFAQAQD